MNQTTRCSQENCDQPGFYRYTWPGKDQALACPMHAEAISHVASAMGFPIEMISLPADAHEDECARALHRLAKGFNLPDEGPDENVTEAIKIRAQLVEALMRARAVLHSYCSEGPELSACRVAAEALEAAGVHPAKPVKP